MPPGVPHGMHSGLGAQHGGDANMAALMDSLGGWQLAGGNGAAMAHRGGSMDGMTGMAGAPVSTGVASSVHQRLAVSCRAEVPLAAAGSYRRRPLTLCPPPLCLQGMHGPPNGYYDAKGIWGSQEAINNQAGAES